MSFSESSLFRLDASGWQDNKGDPVLTPTELAFVAMMGGLGLGIGIFAVAIQLNPSVSIPLWPNDLGFVLIVIGIGLLAYAFHAASKMPK